MRTVARSFAAAALMLWTAAANALWSVSLDAESFKWQEATTPSSVTEKGPRWGFSWEYEQLRDAGWQFAYRGALRRGTVDYSGSLLFDPTQPATAQTVYTGLVNEAQGIYRFAGSPFGLELVGGLGWDLWRRNILPDQREDYSVFYLRLGLNLDPRSSQGWFGGGGVKYPYYVWENAHLDELGFDRNPPLEPKAEATFYAQLGYRFTPQWSVIGYYDSYRFTQSKDVVVRQGSSVFDVHQPASTLDAVGLRVRYSFR